MTYKFRLYPTEEAKEVMQFHCDQARYVWNIFLEQFHTARWLDSFATNPQHKIDLLSINKYRWSKELTEARAEFEWLREGSRQAQEAALQDLYQAFLDWWNSSTRFGIPQYRSKRTSNGFLIKDVSILKFNNRWATINIPKYGHVKFRLTRKFKLLLKSKSARIKKTKSGNWYITFATKRVESKHKVNTAQVIGIDVGIANTITLSNGEHFQLPQLLSKEKEQRLKRLERKMARQQLGSNSREQTRLAIAKLSEEEAAARKDWHEKITTELAMKYDYLFIEKLDIIKMANKEVGKRNLNRNIYNSAWGYFFRRLQDKNPNVIKVNPAYTSRTCNSCGYEDIKNRLSQSEFLCISCGHSANADVNAALNICAAGLAVSGGGAFFDIGQGYETPTIKPSLLVF